MVDFKINEINKFFSPKLPQKMQNKAPKKRLVINTNRKKPVLKVNNLPAPLCYLTEEMVAIIMDYYTLRYLAHKSMGLRLSCSSNYKAFRLDSFYLEGEENKALSFFEGKWRCLTKYSALFWPEAVVLMNSLSLAYVDSEYDNNFKKLTVVGPRAVEKLIQYMLSILRKL